MKPTYLYIKQHRITKLKYFGKTTKENPKDYLGSGKHWKRHLKKHGEYVDTIWLKLFTNESELTNYALKFSKENNIVESSEWANLKEENGLDGGFDKGGWTQQQIENFRQKQKQRWANGLVDPEKLRLSRIGFKQPESQKKAVAKALSKEFLIIDPDGNEYKICNLTQFCKNNNLDQGNMANVSRGKLKHYKQWKCVKLTT